MLWKEKTSNPSPPVEEAPTAPLPSSALDASQLTLETRTQSSETGLTTLPLDICTLILDHIASEPFTAVATLYRCALVSRAWTAVALERMYLHVELRCMGTKRMQKLAMSEGMKDYYTRSLSFHEIRQWEDITGVQVGADLLAKCDGLGELAFVRGEDHDSAVPQSLFEHPSLAHLEVLTLRQAVKFQPNIPPIINFRLRKLRTDLRTSQVEVLKAIVTASLAGPSPSLTDIELFRRPLIYLPYGYGVVLQPIHLELLEPLAPTILSLSFPPSQFFDSTKFDDPDLKAQLSFLPLATSLKQLSIVADPRSDRSKMPTFISLYVKEVRSILSHLHLDIYPSHLSQQLFTELVQLLDTVSSIGRLERLEFLKVTIHQLRGTVGWDVFEVALKRRQIRVVCKGI